MSLRVDWHPATRHTFNSLPMLDATRLAAAVIRFAETGRGEVERHHPHDANLFRIRVSGALAVFLVDRKEQVLHVIGVYRRR